jgi:hypothetical protein
MNKEEQQDEEQEERERDRERDRNSTNFSNVFGWSGSGDTTSSPRYLYSS